MKEEETLMLDRLAKLSEEGNAMAAGYYLRLVKAQEQGRYKEEEQRIIEEIQAIFNAFRKVFEAVLNFFRPFLGQLVDDLEAENIVQDGQVVRTMVVTPPAEGVGIIMDSLSHGPREVGMSPDLMAHLRTEQMNGGRYRS